MKYAADFRKIARDSLCGNWGVAILTGFVASLLGSNITTSSGVNFNIDDFSNNDINNFISVENLKEIFSVLLIILPILTIWLIATIIIGGAVKLGYAKFNINLIDRKNADFSDLFSQFNRLGQGFCMNFLTGIYITLWSLLFIIPGIIKSYSYAMTPYILAEHTQMTANEAITQSRKIMDGNKGRLFCLEFSFIGWELLCIVPLLVLSPIMLMGYFGFALWLLISIPTVFVSHLFLNPYKEAARAAFYREVSCTNIPPFDPATKDIEIID